jgi:tetratricopeptide (TPR) repeat protein
MPLLHQRTIKIFKYIGGGVLLFGAVLDSVGNAISLITPLVASVGTVCIVLLLLLAHLILPSHPLILVNGDQRIRMLKPGIKLTAYAVGIVILLWIPSVFTQWRPPPPSAEVQPIVEALVKAHQRELAGFHEREQLAQDQIKALTKAVTALTQQHGPHIADAVSQLEQGNSAAAERIFQDIFTRKAAEGKAVNQQAAEAARHLGALAFLHDTKKALHAYRQAVRFDPENFEGWAQLGHLLVRLGQVDQATDAYRKLLALGEERGNRGLVAIAYGNLGNVYEIRGDLDQAEAMYRKALELHEALGHKVGVANQYGNLGLVYRTRGDLDQAEAMYRKALELYEALGYKVGVANQYGNLGLVHQIRG